MFLNITKFKSYIKKAYKSMLGLGVARDKDDIVIVDAGFLYVEADLRETTKEFRAALIEVCGRIPEAGEAVTFGEDGDQKAVLERYHKQLFIRTPKPTDRMFEVTPLTIGDRILMQSSEGEVIMVKGAVLNIFSPTSIEENEDRPGEWKTACPGMVATSTETMLMGMHIMPTEYLGEQKILDALVGTKLNYSKLDEDRL